MKKILFLTGTRADFGKLKPLIRGVAADPEQSDIRMLSFRMAALAGDLNWSQLCKLWPCSLTNFRVLAWEFAPREAAPQ